MGSSHASTNYMKSWSHHSIFTTMQESKATISVEDENNDIVLAANEKLGYELARDACVASLAYLLKPLQDVANEL